MIQFIIMMTLLVAVFTGCAATPHHVSQSADLSHRVQLLGFAACPNTPLMEKRLRMALDRIGASSPIEYVDQDALEAGDVQRGWPAPTVLVDGQDLYGMTPPRTPSMGCRMYAGPGGLPTVDELVQRLNGTGLDSGVSHQ